jgi:hypothetical protein
VQLFVMSRKTVLQGTCASWLVVNLNKQLVLVSRLWHGVAYETNKRECSWSEWQLQSHCWKKAS